MLACARGGITHALLNLTLLPARRRIAELGIEDVVAGHGQKPRIYIAPFTDANPVDGCLHVVVDATPGDALKNAEPVPVGIKQHLMCLQQIGPHQECAAMRQLDMGDLQLDALTADIGPVLTPVELESLARREHQRHESPAICRVMRTLPFTLPVPHESRNTLVGTVIPKLYKIGMHQLRRSPFGAPCVICADQSSAML